MKTRIRHAVEYVIEKESSIEKCSNTWDDPVGFDLPVQPLSECHHRRARQRQIDIAGIHVRFRFCARQRDSKTLDWRKREIFQHRWRQPGSRQQQTIVNLSDRRAKRYRSDLVGGGGLRLHWNQKRTTVWQASRDDIKSLFPAYIYSQKQIFALAQQPDALLGIIDKDRLCTRVFEKKREVARE